MEHQRLGAEVKAVFGLALFLIALGLAADSVEFGWLLAFVVVPMLWFCISRAPLRSTLLTLTFFALVLENPAEAPAAGAWKSPLFMLGALMLTHFKAVFGGWMFFSGMDLMLGVTVLVAYSRSKRTRSLTPRPMIKLAWLCYAAIALVYVVGKLRGMQDPNMAVWQIDRVMYLPMVFLLAQAAFTGPNDHISLGKVIVSAGVIRACLAMYVRGTVPAKIDPATGESTLAYATTHNDSMLFALSAVISVALLVQRVGPPATRWALLLLPVITGGMIANDRRMVWVQIILVFATLYFMTEKNVFKRKLERVLLLLAPVALAYIVGGWSSKANIFKPVQTIRSAVEPDTDASTMWREIENYNLLYTIRQFPFFGTGYGNGFWEVMPLPAVDYSLERFIPHNSALGLWCYYGYFGYFGITALWVAGVFMGVRAYHFSKVPVDKAAALASFASVLIYYVQTFGDVGLGSWTGVFTVAPSLAVACKLAVKSGAWQIAQKPATPTVKARGTAWRNREHEAK